MQNPNFSVSFNETTASKEQVINRLFCDPGDARRPLFEEINFPSSERTRLQPGAPLLIPHSQNVTINGKKTAQTIAQSTARASAGVIMSPGAAIFQNEENDLLMAMVAGGGNIAKYMGKRLDYIEKDLKTLDRLYRDAPKANMKLGSQQFRDSKAQIMARLDRQMTGFARDHILGKEKARGLKSALGFKTRATGVPFELGGNGVQNVRKISEMTKNSQALSNKVKGASNKLALLSIGIYGAEVLNTFQEKGAYEGGRKGFANTYKFIGGKYGAKAGAVAGAKVAAALAFGVGTGGVGFALLGVAAVGAGIVGGSMLGAKGGELAGEMTFDGYAGLAGLGGDLVSGLRSRF